jgi:hypothetical protein
VTGEAFSDDRGQVIGDPIGRPQEQVLFSDFKSLNSSLTEDVRRSLGVQPTLVSSSSMFSQPYSSIVKICASCCRMFWLCVAVCDQPVHGLQTWSILMVFTIALVLSSRCTVTPLLRLSHKLRCCSGSQNYIVLTAGHCVYDVDSSKWATSIWVVPGSLMMSLGFRSFGRCL